MARKANFVPVETVAVGDTVSLSWRDSDVTRTALGRIAAIEVAGKTRILIAESGAEIARYELHAKTVICEMVARNVPQQSALFDYDGELV